MPSPGYLGYGYYAAPGGAALGYRKFAYFLPPAGGGGGGADGIYFPAGYVPFGFWKQGYFRLAEAPATVTPGTPTTLAGWLATARQYLIDHGVATDVRCWVALDPEPSPLPGGVLLVLTQGPQRPEGAVVDSAGRFVPLVRGSFSVHVIDRSLRDVVGRDTLRLTAQAVGLYRAAHAVIDALQLVPDDLLDQDGNALLAEPLRLAREGAPRPYTRDGAWCGVELEFEVLYALDLG